MKIIGITGGVGCGKSTILKLLTKHVNSYLIMADDVAKGLYQPDSTLVKDICREFGTACLNADGSVNRPELAKIIFSDEDKRKKLNSMVHPIVKQTILDIIDKIKNENKYDYIFVEAALFFEEKYDAFCDEVWYITASSDIRRIRLKTDRGYSDDKIDAILKTQLSEDEFIKRCNKVIDNSGSLEETESLLVKLLQL